MNHENEQHLGPTLEHLASHWERQRSAAAARERRNLPRNGFTVALEREVAANGTCIAREVGNRVGWHVYDHELLERIAQDMGLRTVLLESVDEREKNWLTEAFEAFLAAPRTSAWQPFLSEIAFIHQLLKIILALGAHGECVIVGRGAALVLPAATTLRVRLVGPVQERIAVWSKKLGISEREAALQVRKIDRERVDFVRDHFHKDPTDPAQLRSHSQYGTFIRRRQRRHHRRDAPAPARSRDRKGNDSVTGATNMLALRTILHPTDFSASSASALHLAVALARDHGDRLILLHVRPPAETVVGEFGMTPPDPTEDPLEIEENFRRILPADPKIVIERRLLDGDPATQIIAFAKACECDLIAMGTHGHTGLRHLLLGGVAEQVVRKAACPVVVVRTRLHASSST